MSITWIPSQRKRSLSLRKLRTKEGTTETQGIQARRQRARVDLVSDRPGHSRNNGNGRGSSYPPPIQNNMKLGFCLPPCTRT